MVMSTPVEITWLLAAVTKGDAAAFERLLQRPCNVFLADQIAESFGTPFARKYEM